MPQRPNDRAQQFSNSIQNSFVFRSVADIDVEVAIRNLKNKSSPLNTYPTKVVKVISPLIVPILTKLINDSISQSHFPESLKIARVIPIFKSGDKSNVTNYRPISILPVFSKIFERIIYNQLYKFLEKFNILHDNQYGFRKQRSTSQAILDYMQSIYEGLDGGDLVVSIFLDFSKVFDSIDHKILLKKLYSNGVRGVALAWFKSYLENRKQYVNVNEIESEIRIIPCGVPQGSILGPLLFLIFINDFPNCNSFFKFTLFADDSNLLCKSSNRSTGEMRELINFNLIDVNNWLISNKIKINIDKSKFMIFSYRNPIQMNPLIFGEGSIVSTQSIKFLGVTIDENLRFQEHIINLKSSLSRKVGLLYRLNKFLPFEILKLIYQSLILPRLYYGIILWYSAPQYLVQKLSVIQKKCIRAICNLQYNTSTGSHFKNLKLLKLEDIYRVNLLNHFHDTLSLNINTNLKSILYPHEIIHNYSTRNRTDLIQPLVNRTKTQQGFYCRGIREWNSLPAYLKQTRSKTRFHRSIVDLTLSQY